MKNLEFVSNENLNNFIENANNPNTEPEELRTAYYLFDWLEMDEKAKLIEINPNIGKEFLFELLYLGKDISENPLIGILDIENPNWIDSITENGLEWHINAHRLSMILISNYKFWCKRFLNSTNLDLKLQLGYYQQNVISPDYYPDVVEYYPEIIETLFKEQNLNVTSTLLLCKHLTEEQIQELYDRGNNDYMDCMRIAEHPNAPFSLLEKFITHDMNRVKAYAASHTKATKEMQIRLANDNNYGAKWEFLYNCKHMCHEALNILLKDSEEMIREMAEERLQNGKK